MNVRPGRITMLASCKYPTSDSRSLLLQHFRYAHLWSLDCRRCSFSAGSLSSNCMVYVSSSIPRNVRVARGWALFLANCKGDFEGVACFYQEVKVILAFV